MKTLKLVFGILTFLLAFNVSAQADSIIVSSDGYTDAMNDIMYEIKIEQTLAPTWKVGDDDSDLKGNLQNVFTDFGAADLYASTSYNVHNLYVEPGYYSVEKRVSVTEWVKTLGPNMYPSNYQFVYNNSLPHIETLTIYDADGSKIRSISIGWDNSFDNTNYTNLRYISDTYYN